MSRMLCAMPGAGASVWAAPYAAASARASGLMSIAITLASHAAAIMSADNPTPPQPRIATHSPADAQADARPTCRTARYAVAKRQPRLAAPSKLKTVGQPHKVRLSPRNGDVFGKGTPVSETRLFLVKADLLVAVPALRAGSTSQDERRGDAIPRRPSVH